MKNQPERTAPRVADILRHWREKLDEFLVEAVIRLHEGGFTQSEIIDECGVDRKTVRRILGPARKSLGPARKSGGLVGRHGGLKGRILRREDMVKAAREHLTAREVAEKYGVSVSAVYYAASKFETRLRRCSGQGGEYWVSPCKIGGPSYMRYKQYAEQGLSASQIADMMQVGVYTVRSYCRIHHIHLESWE